MKAGACLIESNLDPTWGIECLIRGYDKCRLCGSRPARLVVRLWEDGFRTRVPLCDVHLKASIAAFKQNTLDAANCAPALPKLAAPEPDVLFDSTPTGQRIANEDSRPLTAYLQGTIKWPHHNI